MPLITLPPLRPASSPGARRARREQVPTAAVRCAALLAGCVAAAGAGAQAVSTLSPLVPAGASADAALPPAPWAAALLPDQQLPATRYRFETIDGEPTLRIQAEGSYGNLVHPLSGVPGSGQLSWRWRVESFNPAADLRRREADDTAIKVCALFDMPLDRVPFVERQLLRIARSRSAQPLPAATVCYVWDARLPEGTRLDNPYSRRVRTMVLRSGQAAGSPAWQTERRDLAADFRSLFGDESPGQTPPLLAVAVGADADNTGGRSLAHLADLALRP